MRIEPKDIPEARYTFECYSCVLRKYDPLNEVRHTLHYPQVIKQYMMTSLDFDVSEQHYQLLQSRNESYQIEFRGIRIEGKYLYEITWPDLGELLFNEQKILEWKPLQNNSALKKRKDDKLPFRECQFIYKGRNRLTIREFQPSTEQRSQLKLGDNPIHVVGIYLVKKLSTDELIQKIKQSNMRKEHLCKQQIRESFKNNFSDIAIDKLNISLNCNFTFQMINTPAKGRFCKHIQCFSLENFIVISEQQQPRKWRCPFCKVKCFDIIVDEYIYNIIKELKVKFADPVKEVTFNAQAEYEIQAMGDKDVASDDSSNLEKPHPKPCNLKAEPEQGAATADKAQKQPGNEPANRPATASHNAQQPAQDNNIIILDSEEEKEPHTSQQQQQ